MSSKEAIRTNPRLWESIKKKYLRSSKGGLSGRWSARKAQMAVTEYKKRGGGYIGRKSSKNSLLKWTKEKWGYISDTEWKKGGRISTRKDERYLPQKVRRSLSRKEKSIENRKKRGNYGRWIPYSSSVVKKMKSKGIIKSKKSKRSKRRSRR